jgi:ribosomal protein S18 acetylase RimI-like enzyme
MTDSGIIRRASPDDLNNIVELEKKCFQEDISYSRRQLRYLLTKAHSTFLVEALDGVVRGFIIILYRRGTTVAGVETVDVNPNNHKQGIGLCLLEAAEEDMKNKGIRKIRLEVSTTNLAAIVLYKKAGFRTTSLIKNYYIYRHHGSRDAFRMIKELH